MVKRNGELHVPLLIRSHDEARFGGCLATKERELEVERQHWTTTTTQEQLQINRENDNNKVTQSAWPGGAAP